MLLSSMSDFTCKGCFKYMQYLLYFPIILQNPETKPDSDKPAQVPRQALHAEPGIFSAPHSHLSVTAPDKAGKSKYLRQQSPSSHSWTYPAAPMQWGRSCEGSFNERCKFMSGIFHLNNHFSHSRSSQGLLCKVFFPGVLFFPHSAGVQDFRQQTLPFQHHSAVIKKGDQPLHQLHKF